MYEHIAQVEKYIGRKITVLKPPKSFDYWFSEHVKTKGKRIGEKGYGWPTMRIRWCTSKLKVDVCNRYLKQYNEPYTLYIGIAKDEPKRHEKKNDNTVHPLYDWGITEKEALQYCYDKGFNWSGLYEDFKRVSCWCCPLQALSELRVLYRKYPELWEELKEMDKKVHNNNSFKANYTVAQLEERFKNELEGDKDI